MELSAMDVHFVVRELEQLADAKVEKVYQSADDRKDVMLQMYLRDMPKLFLRCKLPGMLCLQEEKSAYPKEPPAFAMFLRKYLIGGRITKVTQVGFERIIMIDFSSKEGSSTLVLEVLAPGNVLLLMDGKVKNLAEQQRHKDRTMRGGVMYEPPPAQLDLKVLSDDEIVEKITTSTRKSVVTTLAMTLGLGGVYAEEVCVRANVEKDRTDLKKEEIVQIVHEIRLLFEMPIEPHVDDGRAYPFAFVSRHVKKSEHKMFLNALAPFVPEPVDGIVEKQQVSVKKDKLQEMITIQSKRLIELEDEEKKEKRKGELIYENYQQIQEILMIVKTAKEEKQEPDLSQHPGCTYNKKTGMVEVEFE